MKKIYRNEDGDRVVLDLKHDTCLYSAPVNPPNTGTRYTAGTDLYVHKSKNKGLETFYMYRWSMWQGAQEEIQVITRDEAIQYLEERVGDYWGFPDQEDLKLLQQYNIHLLEETA